MNHYIDPSDRLTTDRDITQVAVQKLDSAVQRGEVTETPGAEMVDVPHRMTEREHALGRLQGWRRGGDGLKVGSRTLSLSRTMI